MNLRSIMMSYKFKRILESIEKSQKVINVLPLENNILDNILNKYDINKDGILGTILYNTGGIIIDKWIRILGSGKLNFDLKNQSFPYDNIVVAEDILGGLFLFMNNGNIGYFAPDLLEFEDLEITYSQFIYWCIQGDTDTFYVNYRWNNWEEEVKDISLDNGVAFYPFLWTDADSIESRTRKQIPMSEIIGLEFDFLKQL